MDPTLVKMAIGGIALLGCIGLFFGIGLALAAHKFAVETNPLVEEVLEVLPGANCGGCGYGGCEGYAMAVVEDPEVPPNRCVPGREAVAKKVAEITGKKMSAVEDVIAVVRCSKTEGQVSQKYQYIGYQTCTAANLANGGPSACQYSCIGLGDCARACPFNAIQIKGGFPDIDPDICVGCGTCAKTCPKGIIEIQTKKARVWLPCSSKDKGKEVKDVCKVGCISCKMCVKTCPAKAITYKDNQIHIDHKACIEYGSECNEICVEKCPRHILRIYNPDAQRAVNANNERKMATA